MANQNEAVESTEEVQTSVPSSPEVEEQTPQQEEPQATDETPVEKEEKVMGEPQMTGEQSRAFQEQRLEIKRLKEELEGKRKKESAFDSLRPSFTPQQISSGQERVDINNFIDPTTGEFQAHAYNEEVNRAILQQSAVAAQKAQIASQQAIDERLAREKFPQLDPSSPEFDQEFENRVASQYFYEYYKGNDPSIVNIASRESKMTVKQAKALEKQTAEATRQQLSKKEQAGLSAEGTSQPNATTSQRLKDLQVRSRHGDHWAVAERLKNVRA